MKRLVLLAAASALVLTAQPKKILVSGQTPDVMKDWQSVSDKVKLVDVTKDNVMQEMAGADAFIGGDISPEMVRAGKGPQVGPSAERRRRKSSAFVRRR